MNKISIRNNFTNLIILQMIVLSGTLFFAGQSYAQTANVPDVPTGFTATPVSPTSVFLAWSPPQNNGGAAITGYEIDYRMVPNPSDTTLVRLGNVTNYTHTNLVTGKTYLYRVFAINSAGNGSPTPEQSATPTSSSAPPQNIVPNPPQSLGATVYSSTQINLSWSSPVSNGGPPVTGYKIDYQLDSGNFTNLVANSGSSFTAYSHTGLQTGHTYTYRVFAINSIGISNSSNTASATPVVVNTVPGSPTLSANPASATSVSLSWIAPSNNGGMPITGYKIEYSNGTSNFIVLVANTGTSNTSYTHSRLVTGTSYTYRVSAINSLGVGSPSNSVTVTPQDTMTPIITTAIAISPTSAKISWIAPSQTYGQIISGYTIDQVINGNMLPIDDSIQGSTTSYTISGLTTGKTYSFVVSAQLSGGSQTNPSPPATITPTSTSTPPDSSQTPTQTPSQNQTLPDPPTRLNATMITSSSVQVTWIAPSNNGKLPVTGYKVESMTGQSGAWVTDTTNTGVQTSFVKSGLQAGVSYYFRVSSISNAGISQPSSQVPVIVPSQNTNQNSSPPPFIPQQSQGFVSVINTTSTISYKIIGGQILTAGINQDTFSLNVNIRASSPGVLSIQLPRDMIDSKKPDGTDETYIVADDQNLAKFNETKTSAYRTLNISFPANTNKISIYGTSAVPEFPTALVVLLIAIVSAIVFSNRIIRY
ncbi:MAG: fibronectin type III domain-containing protein [Nitrososphaera sp.]|jgi:titin